MRASILLLSFTCLSLPLTTGCSGSAPAKPAAVKGHDDHAHPSKGPNGGDLIELGDEEYHAEIVVNEKTNEVAIYILDKSAKKSVPIESKEIVINLKHEGKAEQHKLVASPLPADGEGKASRFVVKDNPELHEDLERKGADPRLQVTIEGKSFSGKIAHEHGDHKGDEKGHKH